MKHVTIKTFRKDLPLNKIEVSEDNVRHTKQKVGLEDLKDSIKNYRYNYVIQAYKGGVVAISSTVSDMTITKT